MTDPEIRERATAIATDACPEDQPIASTVRDIIALVNEAVAGERERCARAAEHPTEPGELTECQPDTSVQSYSEGFKHASRLITAKIRLG